MAGHKQHTIRRRPTDHTCRPWGWKHYSCTEGHAYLSESVELQGQCLAFHLGERCTGQLVAS